MNEKFLLENSMESVGDFYVDAAGIAILLYIRLMSSNNVLQNNYIFDREKTTAYTNTVYKYWDEEQIINKKAPMR